MHDALAGRSRVSYEPLTEGQKAELRRQALAYLNGEIDDLEVGVSSRVLTETQGCVRSKYERIICSNEAFVF
jgi:hypothetical protein